MIEFALVTDSCYTLHLFVIDARPLTKRGSPTCSPSPKRSNEPSGRIMVLGVRIAVVLIFIQSNWQFISYLASSDGISTLPILGSKSDVKTYSYDYTSLCTENWLKQKLHEAQFCKIYSQFLSWMGKTSNGKRISS